MLKEKGERRSRERQSEWKRDGCRETRGNMLKSERERQNSKSRQVTTKRGWRVLAKEAVWGGTLGWGEGRRNGALARARVSKLDFQQNSAGVRTIR